MARAYTIWVVNKAGVDGPTAAFTVKAELIRWLNNQDEPERLSIYALRDGRQARVRYYGGWIEVLPFEERRMEMMG